MQNRDTSAVYGNNRIRTPLHPWEEAGTMEEGAHEFVRSPRCNVTGNGGCKIEVAGSKTYAVDDDCENYRSTEGHILVTTREH